MGGGGVQWDLAGDGGWSGAGEGGAVGRGQRAEAPPAPSCRLLLAQLLAGSPCTRAPARLSSKRRLSSTACRYRLRGEDHAAAIAELCGAFAAAPAVARAVVDLHLSRINCAPPIAALSAAFPSVVRLHLVGGFCLRGVLGE